MRGSALGVVMGQPDEPVTDGDTVTGQMDASAAALRARAEQWRAEGDALEAARLQRLAVQLETWARERRRRAQDDSRALL
jgi:hypothetical protein